MISQIRNSVFTKVLWVLMGLFRINISVDTADPYPDHIPENLTINDQESVVELVVEQFLGYENAIEEYEDHDTEEHHKKTNVKVDLFLELTLDSINNQSFFAITKQKLPHPTAYLTSGFYQPFTPPPEG